MLRIAPVLPAGTAGKMPLNAPDAEFAAREQLISRATQRDRSLQLSCDMAIFNLFSRFFRRTDGASPASSPSREPTSREASQESLRGQQQHAISPPGGGDRSGVESDSALDSRASAMRAPKHCLNARDRQTPGGAVVRDFPSPPGARRELTEAATDLREVPAGRAWAAGSSGSGGFGAFLPNGQPADEYRPTTGENRAAPVPSEDAVARSLEDSLKRVPPSAGSSREKPSGRVRKAR